MKKTLLALLLIPSVLAATDSAKPASQLSDLTGGRYAVKISGFLCTACTRAAVAELSKLNEVQTVTADFDKEELLLKVKAERTLTVAALRKALKRAAKRVNLGTQFEIESIVYKPLQ